MNNTVLSIIIPVYQAEAVIEQCISAIANQECTDELEVILINDGSTDYSWEKCKKIAEHYSWVRIYTHDNQGVSYTRNKGIQYANGKYIWFVDVDDIIIDGCLKKILPIIKQEDPDILFFGYKSKLKRKKLNEFDTFPGIKSGMRKKEEFLSEFWKLYSENLIHNVGTKIYRRKMVLDNHVLFADKVSICEDALFCVEALSNADNIYIFNDVFYCYNLECNINSLNSGYRHNYLAAVELLFAKLSEIVGEEEQAINYYYLASLKSVFLNEFRIRGNKYKRIKNLFQSISIDKIKEKTNDLKFGKDDKYFWNRFVSQDYQACYFYLLKIHIKNSFVKSNFYNICFDVFYSLYKLVFGRR